MYDFCKYNCTVRVISLWKNLPTHVIWQRFCKMLLNLMLCFSYYALQCKMRAQRSQAYAHSCTFMLCLCLGVRLTLRINGMGYG